jgi:dihydroorotate dehydrogenase (NAD+) catalytic subunit
LPLVADAELRGEADISQNTYRLDRSYAWNYAHTPSLPRVRRLPEGPGARLFGHLLRSPLGVAAGPLLNSKWVEAYGRLGYDILTYGTVRSCFQPALTLPNIRPVENREEFALALRRTSPNGNMTIALSLGSPSMEPDIWRKDVRRAKERIDRGQLLVVSVAGTVEPGQDAEALITDYARCAAWAADAGADVIEVHLAQPNTFGDQPQLIYESIPLAAQILYRVRTSVTVPVIAKLGPFRTPRALHETATKLAPWASGFVLVHGLRRRVVDDEGNAAFEGSGRDVAFVVGAETFATCSRQVDEMLAWRKAGAWDRAILAVGGITTVERARLLLREGVDIALVATAALFDPLLALRFRQTRASAA